MRVYRRTYRSRIFARARPQPILRPAHQPRLHRILMNVFHLFVILPYRAQRAVEKARLPKKPLSVRRPLIRRIEPALIDSITREMVSGWAGYKIACPAAAGSGRKTHAVRE